MSEHSETVRLVDTSAPSPGGPENPRSRGTFLTSAVIVANIVMFIAMASDGGGFFEPNGIAAIRYGSNFTILTLSGDWWRLVSCIFVHFGVIHLLMNCYALHGIGSYLEPMLGKLGFAGAYVGSGVCASMASLYWHADGINSAGASGAVFGLYGLFFGLLMTDLLPAEARKALRKASGFFIVFNLLYGLSGGVDNAAHVGGLLAGLLFSWLYVLALKARKRWGQTALCGALFLVLAAAAASVFLEGNKIPQRDREAVLRELQKKSERSLRP